MRKVHEVVPPKALANGMEAFADMIERDPMTGLFNKMGMDQRMERLILMGEPFLLIVLDVDYFKDVNDRHNHEVGNRVIKEIAGVLEHGFRRKDDLARVGGDEFAVCVPLNSPEEDIPADVQESRAREAGEAIEHTRAHISRLSDLFVESVQGLLPNMPAGRLGFSAGIVAFDPENPQPLEELYVQADEAMYIDKRIRKGKVSLARRVLRRVGEAAMHLERRLP